MATQERSVDRGSRLSRAALARVGQDIRQARVGAGLSVSSVGMAASLSKAEVSRIERGLSPKTPVIHVARLAAVVGLDLVLKTYPGGDPLRDAGQQALVAAFGRLLHPSLRWGAEVPLPIVGDARAWDGLVAGPSWRFGVEVETQPSDEQAILRRIRLKERDGQVDGVLLVMPDTRRVRAFVRSASSELARQFPEPGVHVLARLRAGDPPGGSSVILLSRFRVPPDG